MRFVPARIGRTAVRCIAVATIVTAALGVQVGTTAAPSAPSTVTTVDPARILDTRLGIGASGIAPVGPDSSITVQITGQGGVPANATGVILTLTADGATADTYITATPTGTPRSSTSVLNPFAGRTAANTITIGIGTGGQIDLYNYAGNVNLLADVTGYLLPDAAPTGPNPTTVTESIELSAYAGHGVGIGLPGDFGCVDLGNSGSIYLDLPLPHGAVVTKVDFRWFDDDSAEISMFVTEVDSDAAFSMPTQGNLGGNTVNSVGAPGYGSSTVTLSGADAVSSTVRYHVVAFTLGQANISTLHRFCGATVTYTRPFG